LAQSFVVGCWCVPLAADPHVNSSHLLGMLSTACLLALLPLVAGSANDLSACATVGEENVKKIKQLIGVTDDAMDNGVEQERIIKKQAKSGGFFDFFAEKMSCLDSPAAKKFGYPGYEKEDVDKAECIAMRRAPEQSKIKRSPWRSADITWDPSSCGKRVWVHVRERKIEGPDASAENVHSAAMWDFNDDGQIVAELVFPDTLVLKKVLMESVAATKEFADEALPVAARGNTGNLRDGGFLALGLTLGVLGMRTWSWAARKHGSPVSYTRADEA